MNSDSLGAQSRWGTVAGQICLLLIVAFPITWVTGYALAYSLGGVGVFGEGWTTQHWRTALSTPGLSRSVIHSVTVATIVTALSASGAIGLAVVGSPYRHDRWLRNLLLIPLATPATVMAVLIFQLLSPGGLISRIMVTGGLTETARDFPVLVNDRYVIGMMLAQGATSFPLLALYFLNTWTSARIDRYCEMAISLGATEFQARRRIGIPMLLVRGRSLILLTALWNLGAYEIPLLLGRQSPQMFSVLTARHFGQFDLQQRPQAFVLAVCYLFFASAGVGILLAWRRADE